MQGLRPDQAGCGRLGAPPEAYTKYAEEPERSVTQQIQAYPSLQ